MKSTISEMKNSLEVLNNRFEQSEELLNSKIGSLKLPTLRGRKKNNNEK